MGSERKNSAEETTSFGEGAGIELERLTSDSEGAIGEPFNPDEIDVGTRTMTIDLLLSRIKAKAIDLEPDFQRRRGIWTDRQQSRLIESLLLRIPLPTLYAAEDEEENWAIVDGIQRLTTIARFMEPDSIQEKPLRLSGLEYLGSQFNGNVFDDLSSRFKRRLRETELVVHLIKHGTPEEVKFNIFARINTGGLPLSSQELRHALIPGPARGILKRLASSDLFKKATDFSIHDERMADREMVLRFVAFRLFNPREYKAYDFDRFLGEAMRRLSRLDKVAVAELEADFKSAMEAAYKIFRHDAFRKRYRAGDSRFPINKALFETVSVALAEIGDAGRGRCIDSRQELINAFMELAADRHFDSAISQGTGDVAKVKRRFQMVHELFTRF